MHKIRRVFYPRGVDHSKNLRTPSPKEVKFKKIAQILNKFKPNYANYAKKKMEKKVRKSSTI